MLTLGVAALAGGPARAATLNVANGGFESGTLGGWQSVASGGYASGSGVINNTTNQSDAYPFFSNPLPGTAGGTYYGWICGYDGNPAESLYQDVSNNGLGNAGLQPNTQYTLKVAVGVGKYSYPNEGYIQLVNGSGPSGPVLAEAEVSSLGMNRYAGNFQDLTLTYTSGSIVSGDLTVVIGTVHGAPSSNQLFIDNVRLTSQPAPAETVGGGTVGAPAVGPAPDYAIGGPGFTLVKNWHFGADGTITDIADMNTEFQYHDQFGQYNNGSGQYGADIVAPDAATAVKNQPVEGVATSSPVREFLADSLKTYLVPKIGATTVTPISHNIGSGSFQAKWNLPAGGALLKQDIVWETRVRYVTPPYFWFSIWSSGNYWSKGAEMDLVESFGFNNGGGSTNYVGHYWHSNSVGGTDADPYRNWPNSMSAHGITNYDATQWHVWTLLYRKDDTYVAYVDGQVVQTGTIHWTVAGAVADPNAAPGKPGNPINLDFLFDASWGNTRVSSCNYPLPASAFNGCYYEFNYSRVYLRP